MGLHEIAWSQDARKNGQRENTCKTMQALESGYKDCDERCQYASLCPGCSSRDKVVIILPRMMIIV